MLRPRRRCVDFTSSSALRQRCVDIDIDIASSALCRLRRCVGVALSLRSRCCVLVIVASSASSVLVDDLRDPKFNLRQSADELRVL